MDDDHGDQTTSSRICGLCTEPFIQAMDGLDGPPICPTCMLHFDAGSDHDSTIAPARGAAGGRESVEVSEAPTLAPQGRDVEVERTLDAAVAALHEGKDSLAFEALPGTRLGDYHVDKMLGRGGMGAVFLATHATLKRTSALKVLPAELSADPDRVARFLREAESMAQVRHPNIVAIHNLGNARGFYFIEMEVVEGGTLDDRIKAAQDTEEPMDVQEAARLIRQIAIGLSEAHARGIVHRDIKPENILLTPDGVPKIADFGLAKYSDNPEEAKLTMTGQVIGTPAYMSPEQCRGESTDTTSDVYSLGCVFFELATNRRPFLADRPLALIMAHLGTDAPNPRKIRADLPASLANVIERMIAKAPDERFADAAAVVEALDAIARGEEVAYTARRVRTRRRRLTMAAVAAIILGAVGGYGYREWVLRGNTVIYKDESESARIERLVREAEAAVAAANDTEARSKLEELAGIKPGHPALELGARLDERVAVRRAWRSGDLEEASRLAAKLLAALPDDRTALGVQERVEALLAARRAMTDRAPGAARDAAATLKGLEPEHAEALAIANAAEALERATAAAKREDWRAAGLAAREAMRFLAQDPWAAAVLADAVSMLRRTAVDELAARALPEAEQAAAALKAIAGDDPESAKAVQAIGDARSAFDTAVQGAGTARASDDAAKWLAELDRAQAIWDQPGLDVRISEAREAVRRAEATAMVRDAAQALRSGDPTRAIALLSAAQAHDAGVPGVSPLRAAADAALADAALADARRALDAGELDRGAALLAEALALAPNHPQAGPLATTVAARRARPDGFVFIPAGEYRTGVAGDADNPSRPISLSGLYIAQREVTNAEFAAFVAAGGYTDDQWWDGVDAAGRAALIDQTATPGPAGWEQGRPISGSEQLPVTGVSLAEAQAYAHWASGRLPTEQEWEVAASHDPQGEPRPYPWGTEWDPAAVGIDSGTAPGLAVVGSRGTDRSPFGCFDMAGNAMEWTASAWTAGSTLYAIRGGSTHAIAADNLNLEEGCRLTRRRSRGDRLTTRLPLLGFRLVKEVKP